MQTTLIAAYRLFKKEHTEVKIRFTKFTTPAKECETVNSAPLDILCMHK